jgi:protein-tyrosine-phosphatase
MEDVIYPLLRKAEVIIMATPVFFYGVPAQLKALIDRCQLLWSRRYRMNLHDPNERQRRGFLLALGATRGANLFQGISLTTKYFFDGIGTRMDGSLTYRRIETRGDMAAHPTMRQEVKKEAGRLMEYYCRRIPIVFACRENACRSQMAAAFAQHLAGDRFEVHSAGSSPAVQINPLMVQVMAEKELDLAFRVPVALGELVSNVTPKLLITMGCGEECPLIPGMKRMDWDLPDPAGQSVDFMRKVRDDIEGRVKNLVQSFHLF